MLAVNKKCFCDLQKCLSQCCQPLAGWNVQHSFLDLDLDKCFQLSWLNLCKSMLVDNHFLLKSQKNLFLNLFAIVFFHLEVFYFFTDNYNFKLQLWSVFQLTCFRNVQCSSRGTMFECRLIQINADFWWQKRWVSRILIISERDVYRREFLNYLGTRQKWNVSIHH